MNDNPFPLETDSVREAIARADAARPLPLTTEYALRLMAEEQAELARCFALLPLAEQERHRWLAEDCERRHSYIGGGADEGKRGFSFDPLTNGWTL